MEEAAIYSMMVSICLNRVIDAAKEGGCLFCNISPLIPCPLLVSDYFYSAWTIVFTSNYKREIMDLVSLYLFVVCIANNHV